MKDEFFPVAERVQGYWNMPLMQARMRAHQSLNLGRFQHHYDTWFPAHLQQGHVVQVLMPTQYDRRFDEREMWPRNCLVLGIDVDADTAEPMGIKIMRFSYAANGSSPHEFLFNPDDYRFKINGFRKEAVLRTGQIESIAFDAGRMNYYLDAMGWVDESVMPEIEAAMDAGYVARRQHHEHKDITPYDADNIVCVPSLDPQFYDGEFYDLGISDDNFGKTYSDLNDEEQHALIKRLRANYCIREIQRPDMLRHEKAEIKGEKVALRRMRRGKKKFLSAYLYNHQHHTVSAEDRKTLRADIDELMQVLKAEERELIPEATDAWDDDIDKPSLRKSDLSNFKDVLYAHFGLEMDDLRPHDLSRVFAQTIDPQSLKDLETLGIGGMVRDELSLPEHLWRGRYIMLKIGDIDNSKCTVEAYRPAALWRAYAKLGDDGLPVLAGLEFHPCTRMSAEGSKYKMPVYPFGWKSGRGVNTKQSFLLADKIVRLPIDSPFLHTNHMDSNFRELLPRMVEKFDQKVTRAMVEEEGRIPVFGLQDIPDDWVEIKLPNPPSKDMQHKLSGWKKADFLEPTTPREKKNKRAPV
jgi:hypothetical protein